MEKNLFRVSVPSRKQVMTEEGYNAELESFLDYEATDETKRFIIDMFSSPLMHDEHRKTFNRVYDERGDILIRDLVKTPVRFYAMYLENPQWFGHEPTTVVAIGLINSAKELMMHNNGKKQYRFKRKALEFYTDRAINELYYDAKFLKDGKKYKEKYG
jgi:hypothetical protein